MDIRQVRRLRKGFGANLFGQVIIVAIQIAGVPVLLGSWGPYRYGEWLLLTAVPAYLAISDLGFSQSASNDMAQLIAKGDRAKALSVFQTLISLLICSSGLVLLICSTIIWISPSDLWGSADLSAITMKFSLLFLAIEMSAKLLDGINYAAFRSSGDYALHTTLTMSIYLMQNVAIWVASIAGYEILAACAIFALVRAVGVTLSIAFLKSRHPWLQLSLAGFDIRELRRLVGPAIANVSMPIASAINIQGMVFVIGALFGPVSVAIFSTLRTLTRVVLQLLMTIYTAAEPELAIAYGLGNQPQIARAFEQMLRVAIWAGLILCVGLAATGEWVVRFWTRGHVTFDNALFYCLLGASLSSAIWMGCLIILRAANVHFRIAVFFCVMAILAVLAAAASMNAFHQLWPAGLALFLMDAAVTIYSLHLLTDMLRISEKRLVTKVLDPLPLARAACSLLNIKSNDHQSHL